MVAKGGTETTPGARRSARPRTFVDPTRLVRIDAVAEVILGMDEPHAGWPALVDAIRRGKLDALLDASPVSPGPRRAAPTLLACAARFAPTEVVAALLARGANPRASSGLARPSHRPPAHPLVWAVMGGREATVRALLSAGADPDAGKPIVVATRDGSRGVFEALVDHGASVEIHAETGLTLLQVAEGVRGLAPNRATRSGITARIRSILRAARAGSTEGSLRVIETPRVGEPFGGFARARLEHDLGWLVYAVERPADALLALSCASVVPDAVGVELDIAHRRIFAREARFLVQLTGSRWTWFLAAPELAAGAHGVDPLEGALRLADELRCRVVAFSRDRIDDVSPASSGSDGATSIELDALPFEDRVATLDAFCANEALFLPHAYDASDGDQLVLAVEGVPFVAVARVDAVLLAR